MGEVKEAAITEPGPGRRAWCCFDSDLKRRSGLVLPEYVGNGKGKVGAPLSHTVHLEVNPPDTGDAEDTPERSLLS